MGSDVHINEVDSQLQITESVGSLSPAEVRRLVALVKAELRAQQASSALRDQDCRLQGGAYVSDVTG